MQAEDQQKINQLRQKIQKSNIKAINSLIPVTMTDSIPLNYFRESQIIQDESLLQYKNLKSIYKVAQGLKLKDEKKQKQVHNPFLPPYEEDLYITEMNPQHYLRHNRFNIFKNHLLIITKQFQEQQSGLNESDFKHILLTIKAANGLFFFNCGKDAGTSQPHKHIQVFPQQAKDLPLVNEITKFVRQKKQQRKKSNFHGQNFQNKDLEEIKFPPFKDFHHRLIIFHSQNNKLSDQQKNMHLGYKLLSSKLIQPYLLKCYNLIGTDQFILMIPRKRQAAFNQIGLSSNTFLGFVLFRDKQVLDKYIQLDTSPYQIYKELTFSEEELQKVKQENKQKINQISHK